MNENDFNDFDASVSSAEEVYKTVPVFFPFLKNNWNLTEATGSCSVKKMFWGVFLPGNLSRSG